MPPTLEERIKPFPQAFVHTAGHGSFVTHSVIVQRLLDLYGQYDMRVVREIYDDHVLTGCLLEITVDLDGTPNVVQEYGDCGDPQQKDTNGERAKNAISDGLKRCAMRLGVGLHLWAQDESYLYDKLNTEAD
jgi:hypothetical protein